MMTPGRFAPFAWLLLVSGKAQAFYLQGGASSRVRPISSSKPIALHVRIDDKIVNTEGDADGDWWEADDLEVMQGDNEDFEDAEWMPDRDIAKIKKQMGRRVAHPTAAGDVLKTKKKGEEEQSKKKADEASKNDKSRPSAYTEDEEEVIAAMGGKTTGSNKREPGFMGDCTLKEIAADYSVPICYLADVLCIWGVPVPIDIHARLGDLVTGEQAFAIVEAVYSLDVGVLNDRYSNQNLLQVCEFHDIAISDAFQFSMKEGWSLPFGVQTHLRVEQEDEIIRVYSPY